MIDRLARFIAGHPKTILIIASLLLIPSFFGYISTFVNYDIMSYLPEDIESVQGEDILDKEFGLAANAFLVVDDMSPKDVVRLKGEIVGIKGVSNVTWVDDIADISIPRSMLPDVMTDIFYANDGRSTLLMIQFEQGSATTSTMNAIKEIRTKLNKKCFLSGMSAIITDTKELSDSEAPKYIVIAVVLALIALSLTMDSFVLPLVLLAALGYAVIYNLGTNFFMPGGISYITQSVAAILQLGVTMDYSVFLMDRFNEEQKNTDDRKEAMARAVSSTFVSLAGSSLTTIFGFLALCFMSLTLGFDIGIVMAKGVVFGVMTVVVVLPAFLLLFYKPIYRFRHRRIIPGFKHLNSFIIGHRKVLAVIFAALIIPSYIAKSAVPLDYVISNALPEQLDSVQALGKLKGDFNMATTHFVIIDDDVPSGRVSEMIDEFEAVDGISGIISLNSFVGPAISENMLPESIKQICFKNGKQLMMVNSVYTPSSNEENAQVDELTSIVKKYDPSGYLTGEGAMSKDLITVTDKDFKVTSIISIAAIFILVAIIFKSVSIPVILVAGIELAIMINLAFSLFTGANVSFIAPTIISCVQLGATVDYAILMSTRFREELNKGRNKLEAMQIAAEASDKSIFQSALVFFCATFGVYCVCNIEIVKSICSMLARGAVISGLVIIVFLPALLTCFESIINKTSYRWRTGTVNSEKSGERTEAKSMKASS
ncbi:MAG: MMPL family transporter, partial [Clostridia bacterium]|nr:MMPL family transporter [Clostridia bacterium]